MWWASGWSSVKKLQNQRTEWVENSRTRGPVLRGGCWGGFSSPIAFHEYRVQHTRSWYVFYNRVLSFHNWILCYHETFCSIAKNQRKYLWILYFWNLYHLKFISCEYTNDRYLWGNTWMVSLARGEGVI